MNGLDDPSLSRDALKGFYMFLYSESLRHQEDIDSIVFKMEEASIRAGLTKDEEQALKAEALRYVSF